VNGVYDVNVGWWDWHGAATALQHTGLDF